MGKKLPGFELGGVEDEFLMYELVSGGGVPDFLFLFEEEATFFFDFGGEVASTLNGLSAPEVPLADVELRIFVPAAVLPTVAFLVCELTINR